MFFFILMPGCLVKNPIGFLSHDWSVHRQSLFFGGPFVHVNHRVFKTTIWGWIPLTKRMKGANPNLPSGNARWKSPSKNVGQHLEKCPQNYMVKCTWPYPKYNPVCCCPRWVLERKRDQSEKMTPFTINHHVLSFVDSMPWMDTDWGKTCERKLCISDLSFVQRVYKKMRWHLTPSCHCRACSCWTISASAAERVSRSALWPAATTLFQSLIFHCIYCMYETYISYMYIYCCVFYVWHSAWLTFTGSTECQRSLAGMVSMVSDWVSEELNQLIKKTAEILEETCCLLT